MKLHHVCVCDSIDIPSDQVVYKSVNWSSNHFAGHVSGVYGLAYLQIWLIVHIWVSDLGHECSGNMSHVWDTKNWLGGESIGW